MPECLRNGAGPAGILITRAHSVRCTVRCCVPLGFGNLKHCQRANFNSPRT
ncbi:putative ABC transporter [Histoplasma ohiense]|nr:putative ABC transporter [Histoplasma ohiense (nom. inval.)]